MNTIMDPFKDTLVPLRSNFNANGSVRWRTSVCSIGQWGKILVIIMGFVDTFEQYYKIVPNLPLNILFLMPKI